jgi:hypothetical protein
VLPQIKTVLGEAGDIWPVEIRGDVIIAMIEDAEKRGEISRDSYA